MLRSQLVAYAATGASRRGVAAACGISEGAIRAWVERGKAEPKEEPYGSFSRQYEQAERGLELAASHTEAMKVQVMREQMQEYLAWRQRGPAPLPPIAPEKPKRDADGQEREAYQDERDAYEAKLQEWQAAIAAWATPPEHPDTNDAEWLGKLKMRRYPRDWGTSKHREPDADYDGANWLEQSGLQREQLGALFDDPPELIRLALIDKADAIYQILVSGGFHPKERQPDEVASGDGAGVRSAGE